MNLDRTWRQSGMARYSGYHWCFWIAMCYDTGILPRKGRRLGSRSKYSYHRRENFSSGLYDYSDCMYRTFKRLYHAQSIHDFYKRKRVDAHQHHPNLLHRSTDLRHSINNSVDSTRAKNLDGSPRNLTDFKSLE